MKGHLRERSPGHWAIVYRCTRPGKRSANGIGFAARSAMLYEERRSNRRRFLTAGTTSFRWAQTAVITGE
jgi:hypothetical protein